MYVIRNCLRFETPDFKIESTEKQVVITCFNGTVEVSLDGALKREGPGWFLKEGDHKPVGIALPDSPLDLEMESGMLPGVPEIHLILWHHTKGWWKKTTKKYSFFCRR